MSAPRRVRCTFEIDIDDLRRVRGITDAEIAAVEAGDVVALASGVSVELVREETKEGEPS